MARKMGVHYDRVDVPAAQSLTDGARVPPDVLAAKLVEMIRGLETQPTCLLPTVLSNPFLAH